jgi:hypothetical protein
MPTPRAQLRPRAHTLYVLRINAMHNVRRLVTTVSM